MALIKAATFESGALTGTDAFTTVEGSMALESVSPILGGHSARSNAGGPRDVGNVTFTSTATQSLALYLRVDTIPSGTERLIECRTATTVRWVIEGTSANQLILDFLTGSPSPVMTVGTVYRLEITNNATNGLTAALAVGDGPATVFASTAQDTVAADNIRLGALQTFVTSVVTFDEIHIRDDATMPTLPGFVVPPVELAARLEFGLDIASDIEATRILAARLVMGLDQRANIHVATGKELAARLVFAVDMRPQIRVERQLAARLVFGVDQRLDIQVGAPGQQLAARLVFGLGIQPDTLQVTRTLSARLVFGLDTAAALLVTRQLAARLVMGMDLREGYVGPGTGLVVGGVRDPLATLREGDTFAIWLPWGGLQGTSGLAHVNSRRVSDERDEQELSLAIIPNDPANVPQLATGATPTPTADGQDLARKQARQAREIDKLERTKR